MATHQQTQRTGREILTFLSSCSEPVTTADVGKALKISVYKARYQLRQLALTGAVQELNQGKGAKSRWRCL